MLFARFTDSLSGGDDDYKTTNARRELKVGDFYEVESVDMGGCYTTIYLKDFPKLPFNSINFEFFEPIDIYEDERYNFYKRGRV